MYGCLGISPDTVKFVNDCEKELTKEFKKLKKLKTIIV
jgi:hypothetical protein